MSLFGPSRSKGITKEELYFVRGELIAGHNAEKLSTRQVDYVMELLEMAMDADSAVEIRNHWEQVSPEEAKSVETKIADKDALNFSTAQITRVHIVLSKYLDINKVKSLF